MNEDNLKGDGDDADYERGGVKVSIYLYDEIVTITVNQYQPLYVKPDSVSESEIFLFCQQRHRGSRKEDEGDDPGNVRCISADCL